MLKYNLSINFSSIGWVSCILNSLYIWASFIRWCYLIIRCYKLTFYEDSCGHDTTTFNGFLFAILGHSICLDYRCSIRAEPSTASFKATTYTHELKYQSDFSLLGKEKLRFCLRNICKSTVDAWHLQWFKSHPDHEIDACRKFHNLKAGPNHPCVKFKELFRSKGEFLHL